MRHLFVVFQHETDNQTYDDKTFVEAFEIQEVAEGVAEKLQDKFGYFTQFSEEKVFSVEEVLVNDSDNVEEIASIVEEVERKLRSQDV